MRRRREDEDEDEDEDEEDDDDEDEEDNLNTVKSFSMSTEQPFIISTSSHVVLRQCTAMYPGMYILPRTSAAGSAAAAAASQDLGDMALRLLLLLDGGHVFAVDEAEHPPQHRAKHERDRPEQRDGRRGDVRDPDRADLLARIHHHAHPLRVQLAQLVRAQAVHLVDLQQRNGVWGLGLRAG